jgi:hypothetical protein
LSLRWTVSQPYRLGHINALSHQSILLTQGPIPEILAEIAKLLVVVEKLSFFESAILKKNLQKKDFFCFILMKISQHL